MKRRTTLSETAEEPTPESLEKQLGELNSRVRSHIAALWQVPLAYLGIIALTLGDAKIRHSAATPLGIGLFLAGAVVILGMYGWREGAARAVDNIRSIEAKLHLAPTAQTHFWTHEFPHFALVALGMIASLVMGCRLAA